MIVHDRTFKKNELLGKECDAADSLCPCRKCYHPHDFGWRETTGKWRERIVCLTREQGGCPIPKPKPKHMLVKRGFAGYHCRRCGKV